MCIRDSAVAAPSAGAVAAGAVAADTAAAPSAGAVAAGAPSADTAAAPSAGAVAAGAVAADTAAAPSAGAAAPWSPGAQSSEHALTPEEAALGVQPPGGALPGQPATELPAGTPAPKGRRSLLIGVLVAVLLVAVA